MENVLYSKLTHTFTHKLIYTQNKITYNEYVFCMNLRGVFIVDAVDELTVRVPGARVHGDVDDDVRAFFCSGSAPGTLGRAPD